MACTICKDLFRNKFVIWHFDVEVYLQLIIFQKLGKNENLNFSKF